MTETTTNATVSHTAGFEGLHVTSDASSFRVSKDNQGTPIITLSGQSISCQELKSHVATLQSSSNRLVFDVSRVTSVDEIPLTYIVSLLKQSSIELVTTPQQYQKLVSMRFDKLVSPRFTMTTVEGVEPPLPLAASSNHHAWSSSLETPSRERFLQKEAARTAAPPAPPVTKQGTTQVLAREGYVEIIPPTDVLQNDESILTLGTYLRSLEKGETYKLNLSAASGTKGPVLAGVLFQISADRQRHNAPPIEVDLPQAVKEDVMRLCKRATGVTFV